jgi:carbon-monoxide dehydrogenase small subunit
MATKELLDRNPDPDKGEIKEGLADNICRCTGYQNIHKAVDRAADELVDAPSDDLTDRAGGGE